RLHQLEPLGGGPGRALQRAVVGRPADEGKRHDHDRGRRDQRAQDQGGHARASESRATSRRCSRASGHIAISEPPRKMNPATQIRFTSGFTSTWKKTVVPLYWSRITY